MHKVCSTGQLGLGPGSSSIGAGETKWRTSQDDIDKLFMTRLNWSWKKRKPENLSCNTQTMAQREISGDDLRERLFQTFRDRGILDSMKVLYRILYCTVLYNHKHHAFVAINIFDTLHYSGTLSICLRTLTRFKATEVSNLHATFVLCCKEHILNFPRIC